VLRDIAALAGEFGLTNVAPKEAIAVMAFQGLMRSYQPEFVREGVFFKFGGVTVVVKATESPSDTQSIAQADLDEAKLVVFAVVRAAPPLEGVKCFQGDAPAQGPRHMVELRGFISRNEIRKHYKVTKYKTVPGYRVGVKRLKPITDLLWWLEDGGHQHGRD